MAAETVSLRKLSKHLQDASELVDKAMNSDDDEPTLDFSAVRNSLASAILMFEDPPGAADSASGYGGKGGARPGSPGISRVREIFPRKHSHRTHNE